MTVTVITVSVMTASQDTSGGASSDSPEKKPKTGPTSEDEPQFTIDELATASRVPSRTIRFYQSEGALQKPVIRGRIAYYGQHHLERLSQITQLQDRGLQIRAIRDVLGRAAKGEFSLHEWLGSHDQLSSPWAGDRPKVMTEAELQAELDEARPGLVGELIGIGLLERRGNAYLVDSPALLALALRLDRVGMPLETVDAAFQILRKRLGKMAAELTTYFIKHADGFGDNVDAAYEELRPVSLEAVRVIFAREMERRFQEATETGATATFTRRRRTTKKS